MTMMRTVLPVISFFSACWRFPRFQNPGLGGFVEDQNRRRPQKGSGDGETLAPRQRALLRVRLLFRRIHDLGLE